MIAAHPRIRTPSDVPDSALALQRIVVLSSTFHDAPEVARSLAASRLGEIAPSLAERVVLTTCHRAELIGVESAPLHPPPGLRMVRGVGAVERVLTVVAGFDSAIMAEEQLLGQARDAYATALARGETGPILNELLQRALRLGKRARASARPGTNWSLADSAARLVLDRLRRSGGRHRVLVIGAGQMGRLAAIRLADGGANVTVASRDGTRAADVIGVLRRGSHHASTTIRDALTHTADFGAILIAVRGGVAVEALQVGTALVVVDLSAPAAIGRDAAALLGDRLVTIDSLPTGTGGARLTPRVERRLRAELADERDRFIAWLGERRSGDAVALLRRTAADANRRHLERLRRRGLLDARQLAAVEAATTALVGELIHGPTVALRAGGATAADVRRIFGIEG